MESRPACHRACAAFVAILALGLPTFSGCEIHDETVQTLGPPRPWWPPADATRRRDERGSESSSGTRIEYVEGYEAGRRRATAGGLPMLLVFRASWCRWSGELTKGPLADRDLVNLSRRFVCVTIDADRDPSTCTALGVSGFPTVILVDHEGHERFRVTGSMSAGSLALAMHELLGDSSRPQRVAAGEGGAPRR